MNQSNAYCSPVDNSCLELIVHSQDGNNIDKGFFRTASGETFSITEGIPDFTWPTELAEIDAETRATYDSLADNYHIYTPIMFSTYKADETTFRETLTDKLKLEANSKVLEVGCGGGDGSVHIAQRLSEDGEFYLQELSPAFLGKAIEKLKGKFPFPMEFSVGNACYLPFPDNYFDAAHHFGGSNTFSDIGRFCTEITRVVKPGGKVVFGDEGMAPWLRETEFGKIMMNSNPLLRYSPPLKHLPTVVRDVQVEWVLLGAFFIIEFTVGENEPEANYHVPIPSARGGTHWTRYHGNLEGVSDEAKQLALKACKKQGQSMHDWLDELVRKAACKDLGDPS